jgi:hypothetical protein
LLASPFLRRPRSLALASIGLAIALGVATLSTQPAAAVAQPTGYSEAASIPTAAISAIAIDDVSDRIYVPTASEVLVIDGVTDSLIATIPFPSTTTTLPLITVDEVTDTIFVANGVDPLFVIDGDTQTITASIWVGKVTAMVADEATGLLYVSSADASVVYVIDETTNMIGTILANGGGDIAINNQTDLIYVMSKTLRTDLFWSKDMTVIDGQSSSTIATVTFPDPASGATIAVNQETNTVYTTVGHETYLVTAVDGATNALSNPFRVAGTSNLIASDDSANLLYLQSVAGNVEVVDVAAGTVVSAAIVRGDNPQVRHVAVNQVTHKAYATVAVGNSYKVAVISAVVAPTTPVYRFYSPALTDHFYTTSLAEKNQILATYPSSVWTYEGIAYNAFATQVGGTVPLYRFWSPTLKGHFYTANAAEQAQIVRDYPASTWTYEGIADYVYPASTEVTASMPVFRFWSPRFGQHFYTADVDESFGIRRDYAPNIWTYENINFRVPTS